MDDFDRDCQYGYFADMQYHEDTILFEREYNEWLNTLESRDLRVFDADHELREE